MKTYILFNGEEKIIHCFDKSLISRLLSIHPYSFLLNKPVEIALPEDLGVALKKISAPIEMNLYVDKRDAENEINTRLNKSSTCNTLGMIFQKTGQAYYSFSLNNLKSIYEKNTTHYLAAPFSIELTHMEYAMIAGYGDFAVDNF